MRAGATPTDIVLEGGGDPLLSTKDLRKLANATAAVLPAGTPVVVHVDDDLFPDTGRAPGWTRSYIPSVAVVRRGARAPLGLQPRTPAPTRSRSSRKRLQRKGIPVTIGPDADAGEGAVLAETKGHTVDEAVRVMLRISENNVAEVLYRQVARAAGFEASWDGARQAAEQVLRNVGVDPTGMALLDGSGLSRKDRVTPRFLVDVLRVARTLNPAPFTLMFEPDAMPVSGVSGTLDDRYGRFVTKQSRCAQGDVRAKTGTLFDTIGLSGVATTVTGPERIFAILVNDRPQRYSRAVDAPGRGRADGHHHRLLGLTPPPPSVAACARDTPAFTALRARLGVQRSARGQRRARAISPAARATRGPTSASLSSRSASTPTLASRPGTPSTGTAMP